MTNKELAVMEVEEAGQLWEEEQLTAWLQRGDWTVEELTGALEGHGILGIAQEEPYIGLLNALPEGGERYTLESELARRASALLSRQPDVQPTGEPPERLLYNLLMLCAGLAHPDELAEPLLAMWNRRALHGEWEGLDLRYALSAALTSNQVDARLADEWRAMLHGGPTHLLEGNDLDGFEGLLWMPESPAKRGEPSLGTIGDALQGMAARLEVNPERRPQFRALIQRVKETYPDRVTWDLDLVTLADRQHFPGWAVECLPSLFIEIHSQPGGPRRFLVWHMLVACLGKPSRHWRRLKDLCSGYVVEVEVEEPLAKWLYQLSTDLEERRRTFPYPSERGLHGAVSDLLAVFEDQSTGKEREIFRSARQHVFNQVISRRPTSSLRLAS